jgi:hypothetical protein
MVAPAGEDEENEIAAGNERRRQPARADLDSKPTAPKLLAVVI